MNTLNLIIQLGAAITAIAAFFVLLNKIIIFFNDSSPTSKRLKKLTKYKKEYSPYYSEKINNYFNSEIKELSLIKLTGIKNKYRQQKYFDIVISHQDIDDVLLKKLLKLSYIDSENKVKIFNDDIDSLRFRTQSFYKKTWFLGVLFYFSCSASWPFLIYYKYSIGDLSFFKIATFYIPAFLFYGYFWFHMLTNLKPINKCNLNKCLKLLDL